MKFCGTIAVDEWQYVCISPILCIFVFRIGGVIVDGAEVIFVFRIVSMSMCQPCYDITEPYSTLLDFVCCSFGSL